MKKHANELDQIKREKKNGIREEMPERMMLEEMAIIREWLNIANIKKYNDNIIGVSQLQSGLGRDLQAIKNTQSINQLYYSWVLSYQPNRFLKTLKKKQLNMVKQ